MEQILVKNIISQETPAIDIRSKAPTVDLALGAASAVAALTAASAAGGPVLIPKGTYLIDQDVTCSAPLFFAGGVFSIAAGKTLTINGPVQAPPTQIFTGSGTVAFGQGSISEVFPQWWGAVGDGVADDTAALTATFKSLQFTGGRVFFPKGTYLSDKIDLRYHYNITITGPDELANKPYRSVVILKARSVTDVFLQLSDVTDTVTEMPDQTYGMGLGIVVKNIIIDASSKANTGINLCRSNKLLNVKVERAVYDGIVFEGMSQPIWLDNVTSRLNGRDGLRVKAPLTTVYSITNSEFDSNGGNGMTIYCGSTITLKNILLQSNTGNGLHIEQLDPALYDNRIFLSILSIEQVYAEANSGWGLYITSYNTNPAVVLGKIPFLRFSSCSFNSSVGQNAYIRGTDGPEIYASPYLSAAVDPLYNAGAVSSFSFNRPIAPKYGVDLSTVISGGVKFPSTQVASTNVNTLDDYKEGIWASAGIRDNTTNYFTETGTPSRRYQKVGNVVHCFLTYSWSDKGSAAAGDAVFLDVLPYTASPGVIVGASPVTIRVSGGSTDQWALRPVTNTTKAEFIKNGAAAAALVSDLPVAGTLSAQFSYITSQ